MTISIGLVQSTGFAFLFHQGGGGLGIGGGAGSGLDLLPNFNFGSVALVVITLTAGTALLMWMGELITQKGIGNGMSIIIFAAVVAALPNQLSLVKENAGWIWLISILLMYVAMLFAIVYVEQGQRRIPVQFAKRVVGRRMYGGQSTYIPLKVNQSDRLRVLLHRHYVRPGQAGRHHPQAGWLHPRYSPRPADRALPRQDPGSHHAPRSAFHCRRCAASGPRAQHRASR